MQTTSQWDKREVVIKERGDKRVEDGSLIGRHKDGEEERWREKEVEWVAVAMEDRFNPRASLSLTNCQ